MAATQEVVLVVEDDEETLNLLSRALAAHGYDVIWARNGGDTLKLLTRHQGPIGAMIVDVVLPGMSAPEVVEEVRRTHPQACPIYVSAYDEATVRAHGVDPDTMPFLPKPCEPRELVRVVKEVLGRN